MDGLVIVIPARGITGGKTRLSATLSPEARAALSERMLHRVVRAALEADVATAVVVISPDQATLDAAASIDERVTPLRQDTTVPGLNQALTQAREWAVQHGAIAMLILFGDLPLLSVGDVTALAWSDAPVVLAPDRHGRGTNAAMLRLDNVASESDFQFGFGPGSLGAHLEEAERLGLEAITIIAPGTAFDLDTPEDWRMLLDDDVAETGAAMIGAVAGSGTP